MEAKKAKATKFEIFRIADNYKNGDLCWACEHGLTCPIHKIKRHHVAKDREIEFKGEQLF